MLTQAADFRDESEALYALLPNLSDEGVERPTRAASWHADKQRSS